MKTKNLIILSLLLIIIVWGSYVTFNKQKENIITETTTTVMAKLALCSNEYYETEYHAESHFYPGWDNDKRIVIKDFPFYEASIPESDTEILCDREEDIWQEYRGGCCGGDWTGKRCYREKPSLKKISNLTCVQKIKLSGIMYPDSGTYSVGDCFFENDDLNHLSNMVNLEKITFDGCGNNNIDNGWWKNLKNLKEIEIIDMGSSGKLFDSILPVIGKMSQVESVELGFGNIGFYWYAGQRPHLCDWINTWKNVKNINGITINDRREFVVFDSQGKESVIANSCEEWLDSMRKGYEEDSRGY